MYRDEDILKEAEQLRTQIQALGVVKDYRRVEAQIHRNSDIEQKMNHLKAIQKQAVNFQNYGKDQAYSKTEAEIQSISNEVHELPIVEEFKNAQYDANMLLQMMMDTMSETLNTAVDQTQK